MSAQLLEALILASLKYGPGFVTDVIALFKQKEITIDQVESLFANVKPYEAYGIPDKVPVFSTTS
jgi:hypothetical protein